MDLNTTRLHYRYNLAYLIGILSLSIIVLLTVKWGEISDLVKYVSFGLTLTSLFLSLIAIIYTIFSNFTLGNNISLLQTASRNVSESARSLLSLTENLDTRIDAIPKLITGVTDKIEQTHHEILDKLTLSAPVQTSGEKPETPVRLSKGQVERIVSTNSASGLAFLYACQIAHSKAVQLKLPEFVEKIDLMNTAYLEGYIVAMTAAGIIDYTEKSDVYLIKRIDENLPKDLDQRAIEKFKKAARKLEEFKSSPAEFEEAIQAYEGKVRSIKEYFD